jgi:hypothetical protein
MKKLQWLILAVGLAQAIASQAQAPGNAIDVDADVHRVVLENEFFRAFDARASKGTKSPMHSHAPMVLVSMGKSRFRMTTPDGKTTVFDLNPGQTMWVSNAQHSWEILAGELHAIGVEVKSVQGEGAAPAVAERDETDSTRADPEAHHVLFENPHVRVIEGRTSQGRKSAMHSHPPTLLISLDWIRLLLTLPDGKKVVHDFSQNQLLWLPQGGTHSWEAIAGGGRVIAIEVKSAEAALRTGAKPSQ